MYTFKKLSLNKVPHLVEWYLCVDSKWILQTLAMNETSTNMISKAFDNFLDVASKRQKHFSNTLAICMQYVAEMNGCSFAEAVSKTLVEVTEKQMEMLNEGYEILFHKNMISWTVDKDNSIYTTLDVHISDELVFPENDKINLIQFPGGSHWYVEIGNVQVKIDGKDKWDTKEEAQAVANDYVSKSRASRRL